MDDEPITKWLGPILSVTLVITIIVLTFRSQGDWKRIAGVTTGFLAAAIILYIPSIKSFKSVGMEAQFQDRIRIVNASIFQLRSIATFTIKQTLGGAFLFPEAEGKARVSAFKTRDIALRQLKEIGASKEQIKDAVLLFNRLVLGDYYVDISHTIYNILKDDPDLLKRYTEEFNTAFLNNNFDTPPADAWRSFVKKYAKITPDLSELLEDLKYFQENGELRRPEVYFSGPVPL